MVGMNGDYAGTEERTIPMNTQLNLRILAAVAAIASKEETHFYLQGVLVECRPDHVMYVATDGHRLIAVRDNVAEEGQEPNQLVGDWIIPAEICRAFKVSKSRYTSFELGLLSKDGEGLRLQQAAGICQVFKPIDGTFPDWRRIVPAELSGKIEFIERDKAAAVTFNPTYLADFAKFGDMMATGKHNVALNSDGPAVVIFPDERILALLMPMRADTQAKLADAFTARKAFVLGRKPPV
jgi:DNA polymerase III sliding clamp (beta) subunit (PCNA family)